MLGNIEHVAFTQVIYGDTDSIMIHSGLDDIEEVKTIITKVIQEVGWINRFFSSLSVLNLSITKPICIRYLQP